MTAVADAHLKTHTCGRCGNPWDEEHATGRYPTVCPTCDPDAARRRRYQRDLNRARRSQADQLEEALSTIRAMRQEHSERMTAQAREFTESARRLRERLQSQVEVTPTAPCLTGEQQQALAQALSDLPKGEKLGDRKDRLQREIDLALRGMAGHSRAAAFIRAAAVALTLAGEA